MTAHPIDTEALRRQADDAARGLAIYFAPGDIYQLLDALAAAEHRATRAEARVKAVEGVLDRAEDRRPIGVDFDGTPFPALVSSADMRRALEG